MPKHSFSLKHPEISFAIALSLVPSGGLSFFSEKPWVPILIFVLGVIFLCVHIYYRMQGNSIHEPKNENPLALVFPFDYNKESVCSNLKLSNRYLISNEKLPDNKSFHTFFLCVENLSDVVTVKNVKLEVQSINHFLCGVLVDDNLTIKDKPVHIKADLNPHEAELFLLGRGWDETKSGFHSPTICTRSEYESAVSKFNKKKFLLKASGRTYSLLPNNGLRFRVTVYAKGFPSKPYILTLNLKDTLEVIIKPEIQRS